MINTDWERSISALFQVLDRMNDRARSFPVPEIPAARGKCWPASGARSFEPRARRCRHFGTTAPYVVVPLVLRCAQPWPWKCTAHSWPHCTETKPARVFLRCNTGDGSHSSIPSRSIAVCATLYFFFFIISRIPILNSVTELRRWLNPIPAHAISRRARKIGMTDTVTEFENILRKISRLYIFI